MEAMGEIGPNARRVLEARYLVRDSDGRLAEDWDGLCRRVARAVLGKRLTYAELTGVTTTPA